MRRQISFIIILTALLCFPFSAFSQDFPAAIGFNQKVHTFPTNVLAGMFGFQQRQYFQASESAQDAPKVDFSGGSN